MTARVEKALVNSRLLGNPVLPILRGSRGFPFLYRCFGAIDLVFALIADSLLGSSDGCSRISTPARAIDRLRCPFLDVIAITAGTRTGNPLAARGEGQQVKQHQGRSIRQESLFSIGACLCHRFLKCIFQPPKIGYQPKPGAWPGRSSPKSGQSKGDSGRWQRIRTPAEGGRRFFLLHKRGKKGKIQIHLVKIWPRIQPFSNHLPEVASQFRGWL